MLIQAEVRADRNGIQVEIGLPLNEPHQKVISEYIIFGELEFDVSRDLANRNRIGTWSGVEVPRAFISYEATILESPRPPVMSQTPRLEGYPSTVRLEDQALAERLVARWMELPPPARFLALATAASFDWGITLQDKQEVRAWLAVEKKYGKVTALLVLLRAAQLPAKAVEGLQLAEGVMTKPLTWVEVWTGVEWKRMVLVTGGIVIQPPLPSSPGHRTAGSLPTRRKAGRYSLDHRSREY